MLMINGGGAAEAIQQRGFKYVFQTAARISSYADGVLPMIQKYGVKSIALVSRDYAAARDISKAIKQPIDGKDVKVVIDEYFPAGHGRLLLPDRQGPAATAGSVGRAALSRARPSKPSGSFTR